MTVHDLHRGRSERAPTVTPQNLEAEQALLGAMLMYNGAIQQLASIVQPEHFAEEIHRRVADVVLQLHAASKPATPLTVKTYLGGADLGGGVTIPQYLARLAANATAPLAAPDLAREIRDLAARRDLIGIAERLIDRARDAVPSASSLEVASETLTELQNAAAGSATDAMQSISHFGDELMREFEGSIDGSISSNIPSTGFEDLDRVIGGYEPGHVVVLAGRPGMGKTAVINSTVYRSARQGAGCLEFPLEVGTSQMIARHLSDIAYRGPSGSPAFRDIGRRGGELDEHQIDAVRAAHAKLRELPIVMDSRSKVTVAQIGAKVVATKRSMQARGSRLGLVVIDHLDYVSATDRYAGQRTQEIAEIVIALKQIARSQEVCILLASQLSREVEKRAANDRRPGLSDLRNSGDIEQVADAVIFVYRPEYYAVRSAGYLGGDSDAIAAAIDARGKLELVIAKNRSGPTPTVHLFCDMASSSVSSYERGSL